MIPDRIDAARNVLNRHLRRPLVRAGSQDGYALLTVLVFSIVVLVAGAAFFAMSSYETRGALYRQASSEAFYLADGAVERARAKFLDDRNWRDGWSAETAGRGEYDLSVTDTTFQGESDVVRLLAVGRVGPAQRRVEVMAKIPPTGFGLGILVRGNANVNGNLCLNGAMHIVGTADLGNNDSHLACGHHTEGFDIKPPPVRTTPDDYPDATYYYVRGSKIGSKYQARIFNALGQDITTALGDSLVNLTSYDNAKKTFKYKFDSHALIEHYFNETTGVFRKNGGDRAVVVNFGESAVIDPPGTLAISALEIDGAASTTIHTTIINSRFVGVTDEQRLDPGFWTGGLTKVKQAIFEPHYGVALVAHDFQKEGGSLVQVGTTAWPALTYVTNDVVGVNSNFELTGGILTLGDWNSSGGPTITWDAGFLSNLPGYLADNWPDGTSGTLQVLRWQELTSIAP